MGSRIPTPVRYNLQNLKNDHASEISIDSLQFGSNPKYYCKALSILQKKKHVKTIILKIYLNKNIEKIA